jgi:hypothetical protein
MPTYTEMMYNAKHRLNDVSVIWNRLMIFDYYEDEGEIGDWGDEDFSTYKEAKKWVNRYIKKNDHIDYLWKIVDNTTHKTLKNNIDDYDGEDDFDFEWYDDDKELIEEYEQELKEARNAEVSRNIAINKIKRNRIYNDGLGLKLAVKAYSKDF